MTLVIQRLFAMFSPAAAPRDGDSQALAEQALEMPADLAVAARAEAAAGAAQRRGAAPPPPYRVLQEAVAAKLLHAWLQNRHQTLFPLALNLRNLKPEVRALLVELLAAGARMASLEEDGVSQRASAVLATMGGGAEEAALLDRALQQPQPLPGLLDGARDAGLGAHAYAAALLLAGRSGRLERAWTDYLAARFALPAELVLDLERRSGGRRIRRKPR
ncbi:DUF533 domain-containing protein [Teichococcus vastitatis]|uniref:DUF533 domain-containing protein n=1 Tax=Teichococcus vastitatis TaxID=2307076 RepID=A0ABS9WCI3_9PROT|nr:DUF533 domain-containing protein [Pseudoroseomonas vastitatis]MCI0757010.1 DUF533 domain-containing protein [Pseudoroseomonas vastitatis]